AIEAIFYLWFEGGRLGRSPDIMGLRVPPKNSISNHSTQCRFARYFLVLLVIYYYSDRIPSAIGNWVVCLTVITNPYDDHIARLNIGTSCIKAKTILTIKGRNNAVVCICSVDIAPCYDESPFKCRHANNTTGITLPK